MGAFERIRTRGDVHDPASGRDVRRIADGTPTAVCKRDAV